MVFDFNITRPVHKIWCKLMVQRYLGKYLNRNLEVDQLTFDLLDGNIKIDDLSLNVNAVNDILSNINVPLRLIDGYIGQISIAVPWTSLLAEATRMKISDLQLTFQPTEVLKLDDKDAINSMVESVVNSLVSSGELARSVMEQAHKDGASDELENQKSLDSFAKVIDAIYSRFCIDLEQITIRVEQPSKDRSNNISTAIELLCERACFMDEQMRACQQDDQSAEIIKSQPHGIGNITNLNKCIKLEGVKMFTDVFSNISDVSSNTDTNVLITSMHIRREKMKQQSPSRSPQQSLHPDMYTSAMSDMSAFHSCYQSLVQESTLDSSWSPANLETLKPTPSEPKLFSKPIQFLEVIDPITVVLRLKNAGTVGTSSNVDENKVDADFFIKAINIFASPSQIEIVNRFVSAISKPEEHDQKEYGKRMSEEDYAAIAKDFEDPNTGFGRQQGNNITGGCGLNAIGNWQQSEEFGEFTNINLDDTRKADSLKEGYQTLKTNPTSKEETNLKFKIGTLLFYITHCDYLSAHYTKEHGNYKQSINHLCEESSRFFREVENLKLGTQLDLEKIRSSLDKLYHKDHLRIVATSITSSIISKRTGSLESMVAKLIFEKCDIMEYLTKESAPNSSTAMHIPILDYRDMENTDKDPNFKLVLSCSSENKGKTNVELFIGSCKSDIDMSMVDRISDLIVRVPFFDGKSINDFESRRDIPQLKEDLFTPQTETTKTNTLINIKCKNWLINLRIPIADLRDPSGSRLPFSQRHLRDEYVQLSLQDLNCEIPSDCEEATKINLSCSEITGDFCGENLDIPDDQRRFLYGSRLGLDKVKIHIGIDPRLRRSPSVIRSSLPYGTKDMMKSISAPLIMSQKKQEGPFSKTPRLFNPNGMETTENIIQAGTREEIIAFQNNSLESSITKLVFDVPILKFHIAEKKYLENLYNRLVNDLALFQPAAPAFRTDDSLKITALDAFQECTAPKNFDSDESENEEDPLTAVFDKDLFDRSVPHTFCLSLNVNKCSVLCNTVVREKETEIGNGQVSLEFDDVQLGTTVGYHGDINHTFFHLTSKQTFVGSSNDPDSKIPQIIANKDFGKWKKDQTQMEFVKKNDELSNGSTDDSFAIALHMSFKPEENSKNVLVGIALRNSIVYARPFKDLGHFWISQLSELFTLTDEEIQGYDLPTVTTDLHVVLENAIAGYDHNWINPESKLKLRAVFGSCNLSSSVLADMNISKSLFILQNAVLYISGDNGKETVKFGTNHKPVKKFIPVLNVEHTQFDVRISLDTAENQRRTHPAFEFRCENDIIEVWLCADSLAALATIAVEISQSEKIKSNESEINKEGDESNADDRKSVTGESCWSGSTATKHVHVMSEGSDLPDEISRRIRGIIEEATRDENGVGIPVGTDAIDEFRSNFKPEKEKDEFDDTSFGKNRTYSYPTDEEFCMVDDNVLGSGITNVAGEPRVRYCSKNETAKEHNIEVDMNNFEQSDGWRKDALQQFPSELTKPILRYLLRDLSFRVHLYSGNDLSISRPPPKSYSVEEFSEGHGKDQVIPHLARGGQYRDHSVSVVLELSKITYMKQVFDKSNEIFATTLCSIGDIIIKDCVAASDIKEMMYQFSSTKEPRRSYAPLLSVRMSETPTREGKMRVSMLPIKINIDQDTLEFLIDFYEEVSSSVKLPQNANVSNPPKDHSVIEVPAEIIAHGISRQSSSKNKMYPSIPTQLNMEPLTPSPIVAPPPLGDLSYLEAREKNFPASPIRNPILDAPLTASAVSIGNMFESDRNSKLENPDLFSLHTTPSKTTPSSPFDYTGSDESDLTSDLSGDWHEKCNLSFGEMQNRSTIPSNHDILSGSTMMGSVHPMLGNLVDTSSDTEDNGNFLDGLNEESDDKDNIEQFGSPSSTRKNSQETVRMYDDEEFCRSEIYFKEFVFSPSVKIYVDYHGKQKISFEKSGPLYGLLMAFSQLNQMPIELREINNTNGILGKAKCFDYALAEWVNDLLTSTSTKTNALASCGPISPFVTIGRGILDLFWMPVEEMRKENGRVVKGIQRGVGSFGSSSAAGIVGMAQTVTGFVQSLAEMTMMEIQPHDPHKRNKRISRVQAANPSDIRHSFQLAYGILYDGYYDAKDDLERAAQEDRASGNSAVRRVFRYAVPTFLGPLVMATKVTYQLLGGVRNQLRPDLYNDERRKWGDGNVPGGVGQR